MANIFVGFYKQKLLARIEGTRYYVRYMDDTFCVFENNVEARVFYEAPNTLHPTFHYTCVKGKNGDLLVHDVLVHSAVF